MKIIPKKNQLVGRTVDIVQSVGGLALPDAQNRGVTVFAVIDDVGPDVTEYKVGQIVLPHHLNHIYVRGGFHRVIFEDKEVLAVVEGLSEGQLSIGGAAPGSNGRAEVARG